jgi:endonuclease YncB( thermonuclease family)
MGCGAEGADAGAQRRRDCVGGAGEGAGRRGSSGQPFDDPGSGPGLRRANEALRASFGYCKWGGGTNCVVDGDTFYIGGEKVRIAGIDAPETHPSRCADEARLGNAATEQLHALLNSGAVTMTPIDRDRDRYGRLLRNVAVNGADVGEALISAGVAREYGGGRRSWC